MQISATTRADAEPAGLRRSAAELQFPADPGRHLCAQEGQTSLEEAVASACLWGGNAALAGTRMVVGFISPAQPPPQNPADTVEELLSFS